MEAEQRLSSEAAKSLCLSLLYSDSEAEVVELLRKAGYWDWPDMWRYYGDRETNYNTIGNQQSAPDAALVEKIVNSIDARLMGECLARGIDPEGPRAPRTITDAVGRFFGDNPDSAIAGLVREWPDEKRRQVAETITVAATGQRGRGAAPCITVADSGEGQAPSALPRTILSLDRDNKVRIPFVQGKFNMGGAGALECVGERGFQLVLSRRRPAILADDATDDTDSRWGFTMVRREDPKGGLRSSTYTYLAPVGAQRRRRRGDVLTFEADALRIFPERGSAYARKSRWGTAIKLYEYCIPGRAGHILLSGGLMERLDLLLPQVALPVRLHECRAYKGHAGSFDTTLTGLSVRLEDNKAENVEEGFPTSHSFSVQGQRMTARIYAFKKGKGRAYRRHEGIIFSVNGQAHGHLTCDFFRRTSVEMSYLRESILVLVDCSSMDRRAHEKLFKNSRDRLSQCPLRYAIEEQLETMIKGHKLLRALKEQRRREAKQERLSEDKPLAEALHALVRKSPTLSALLNPGKRITNPFRSKEAGESDEPYQGERYPTYWRLKGVPYGQQLERNAHLGSRSRIAFETDATNDYLSRDTDPGEFSLLRLEEGTKRLVGDYSVNLQTGAATLNVELPSGAEEGDRFAFRAEVTDPSRVEPFVNRFLLLVTRPLRSCPGGRRRRRPPKGPGSKRELPGGVELPRITEVVQENPRPGQMAWDDMEPCFHKYSALRAIHAGQTGSGQGETRRDVYDFYVNSDNVFLANEIKTSRDDPDMLRTHFIYGMVLLGLAIIQREVNPEQFGAHKSADGWGDNGAVLEEQVELFSSGAAAVLVPMLRSLGDLEIDE